MDGSIRRSRRRRRRRSVRPPQAVLSPPAPASPPREAVVQGRLSKKMCHGLDSTSSTSSVSHVWADLTDNLIHQIIALLSSFHDFIAFTGTCRSWRVAASSFSSAYTFNFPPLHLKPDISYTRKRSKLGVFSVLRDCKWLLGDPTKRNLSLRCSVPRNSPNCLLYLGCSYGYLIFSYREHCLLADVYACSKVKPPKIQSSGDLEIHFGFLVAPLSSPSSRLILFSKTSMFQWQVGAKSWSEHPLGLRGAGIMQIVIFKGQVFAMDFSERLHIIQLEPQFSMQGVQDLCVKDLVDVGLHDKPWLVACGDTLLMVVLSVTRDQYYRILYGTFQVFRLDFSVEPAKWVKTEKLENLALFVSKDRRTPTFSCMCPERWGGKSNNIYISSKSEDSNEPWTPVELGKMVPDSIVPYSFSSGAPSDYCSQLRSLWVFPNLVYGAGQ